MKKEYTMLDLVTMGIGCMASIEADTAIVKLLILLGVVAGIETKNIVCDKLVERKQGKMDANNNSAERKFQPHVGLYSSKDLVLEEVKRSNFSLEAKAKYLDNHSEYIREFRIEKIAKADRKGSPLSAVEIMKLRDAEDRTRFDAYKEILSLKYEKVR